MLLQRFVQLCWCALALCLWMFADILRHNLATTNATASLSASEEIVGCGTLSYSFEPTGENIELMGNGKKIFKNYCASCHNKNIKDDMTGPALGGVVERWKDYPKEDLYNWIRNSQQLVSENHPRALSLVKEWEDIVMSPFPNLSDEEIEGVLLYIEAF